MLVFQKKLAKVGIVGSDTDSTVNIRNLTYDTASSVDKVKYLVGLYSPTLSLESLSTGEYSVLVQDKTNGSPKTLDVNIPPTTDFKDTQVASFLASKGYTLGFKRDILSSIVQQTIEYFFKNRLYAIDIVKAQGVISVRVAPSNSSNVIAFTLAYTDTLPNGLKVVTQVTAFPYSRYKTDTLTSADGYTQYLRELLQ